MDVTVEVWLYVGVVVTVVTFEPELVEVGVVDADDVADVVAVVL